MVHELINVPCPNQEGMGAASSTIAKNGGGEEGKMVEK
jgi:hypothetical protein